MASDQPPLAVPTRGGSGLCCGRRAVVDLVEVVVAHRERAVLRVGDCYIKVEAVPTKAQREHDILEARPVPVPEVLWFRSGDPSVLVLTEVRGRPLTDQSSAASWREAGQVVRSLHDSPLLDWESWFDPAEVCRCIDLDRTWLVERGLLDRSLADEAHDRSTATLSARQVRSTLTHRDLQAEHVYMDGDEVVGVIDWGDVGVGDPLYDVAVLTSRARDRVPDLERGYGEVDREVLDAWWVERYLGEARWLVEHEYSPDEWLDSLHQSCGETLQAARAGR